MCSVFHPLNYVKNSLRQTICNISAPKCIYTIARMNLNMKKLIYACIAALAVAGCSKSDFYIDADGKYSGGESFSADGGASGEGAGEPGNGLAGNGESGVLTAGEWNDLDNWNYWGGIINGQDYAKFNRYWGLYTANRFACKVVDAAGAPVVGAKLELKSADGDVLWTSKTDNSGIANLWADVFKEESTVNLETCTVSIDGVLQAGNPKVSAWTSAKIEENVYTVASAGSPGNQVDIAFIVDATGSMTDEIDFLKKDLADILTKVGQTQSAFSIFTGTVFYRDEGDDYLTRTSEFTTDISATAAFVKDQYAAGGGDCPEAVHTALETTLTQLQWHTNAYAKIAFMILDAPAHKDHQGVIESMQKSISKFSEAGIKIIPVFCSSDRKDCEFMCRQFAILTGGTYVFLTNDSQVGNSHIVPSVGEYQVEKLNELIIRLINKYIS